MTSFTGLMVLYLLLGFLAYVLGWCGGTHIIENSRPRLWPWTKW